jgi:hypothetical protein
MPQVTWAYAAIERVAEWERWQRDYRFGAFYLLPPDELRSSIDELRREHDPRSAAISPAHISMSDPIVRAMTPDDVAELRDRLAVFEPFRIAFTRPHAAAPYPGVVYSVDPVATILALRDLIHATSLFTDTNAYRRDIPPHLTIAEFISLDQSLALERSLTGQVIEGAWQNDEVVYAIPDNEFTFHPAIRFHLGQPGPA